MPITKFKFNMDWKLHLIDLVVVIIGVTVAFGIGKLAENRKSNSEMITILNAMANEIRQDITVYTTHQIPKNQDVIQNLEALLEMMYDPAANQDTTVSRLKSAVKNYNWTFSRTTYQSIIQSGKIDLIKSDDLKLFIRNTYEVRYSQTRYVADRAIKVRSEIEDYFTEHVDLKLDDSYKEVLDDRPLKNRLSRYKGLLSSKVIEYHNNVKVLNELLDMIKKELGENYIHSEQE